MINTINDLIIAINKIIFPWYMSERHEEKFKTLYEKYDCALLEEAIKIAKVNYIRHDINGEVTHDSAVEFLDKIGGILSNKILEKNDPVESKLNHMRNLINFCYGYVNASIFFDLMDNYVEILEDQGYTPESIPSKIERTCKKIIKRSDNWTQWKNNFEKYVDSLYE